MSATGQPTELNQLLSTCIPRWIDVGEKIGDNPRCSGYCQILRVPGPIDQLVRIGKRRRQPTNNPKPINIAVSNRDAQRAERPESKAIAASANRIVVVIAQNICPGGIHFGTKSAVAERYMSCSSVKETTQIPKKVYPIQASLDARFESLRPVVPYTISAPATWENCSKK